MMAIQTEDPLELYRVQKRPATATIDR
jgi:hypothetical protein